MVDIEKIKLTSKKEDKNNVSSKLELKKADDKEAFIKELQESDAGKEISTKLNEIKSEVNSTKRKEKLIQLVKDSFEVKTESSDAHVQRLVVDGTTYLRIDAGTNKFEVKLPDDLMKSVIDRYIERMISVVNQGKEANDKVSIAYETETNDFIQKTQEELDALQKEVTPPETTPTTPPAPVEEKKPGFFGRLWNRIENVFTGKEDSEKAVEETKKEVGNGLKWLIGIGTSFAGVFGLSKYFDKKDKDATGTATDSGKDMAAEIKGYFEKAKNWVDETFFDKKTEETASSTSAVVTAETEDLPPTVAASPSEEADTSTDAEVAAADPDTDEPVWPHDEELTTA